MDTLIEMGVPRIGVLLVGGASRRMGQDKANLVWRGQTLRSHMLDMLTKLALDRVVISGTQTDIASVPDQTPGRGPLGGISSVACELPDATLLVVPVDMPRMDTPLLARLLNASPPGPAHFVARPLPMRLHLNDALRTWFRHWLADPEAPRALRKFHDRLGSLALPVHDADLERFANANTPDDWAQLTRLDQEQASLRQETP